MNNLMKIHASGENEKRKYKVISIIPISILPIVSIPSVWFLKIVATVQWNFKDLIFLKKVKKLPSPSQTFILDLYGHTYQKLHIKKNKIWIKILF